MAIKMGDVDGLKPGAPNTVVDEIAYPFQTATNSGVSVRASC
jgi:hypothetical protein